MANPNNILDYELKIKFNKDGITVNATGESLAFKQDATNAELRHRHTKLVNSVNDLIRQYIKDNQ